MLNFDARDSAYLLREGHRWALFNIAKWNLTQKPVDYGWVEECKDGHFVSGKFAPVSRIMRSPTTVICANGTLPAAGHAAWTQDRPHIIDLDTSAPGGGSRGTDSPAGMLRA